MKNGAHRIAVVAIFFLLDISPYAQADDVARLSKQLEPWLQLLSGQMEKFTLDGTGDPLIDGNPQPVQFKLVKFDEESFDLDLEHADYAVQLRRRPQGMAFCVPKHKIVYLGIGNIVAEDHVKPTGILTRLVSAGTAVRFGTQLLASSNSEDLAGTLFSLTNLQYSNDKQAWLVDKAQIQFAPDGQQIHAEIDGS